MMGRNLKKMALTIGTGLLLAALAVITHPEWFTNRSTFTLPTIIPTATPGLAAPTPVRPTATPATPLAGMAQHLDDIWVTPFWIEHSQGANSILPNLGDEFLIVHVRIHNRSQTDYSVRLPTFSVLDSHGQIDPPLTKDFTRRGLREVRLIPLGHTEGTLIFEVPRRDPASVLLYQPDTLDPGKRKEWLLR